MNLLSAGRVVRLLPRAELPAGSEELARFLLGKLVVRTLPEGRAAGRIVETEAYLPGDPACHAYKRMTPRNRSLFLPLGHAYVYRAYGVSWMLNVSGEREGVGAGVLIRALEPLEGIEAMEAARGTTRRLDLCRGPGRLAEALRIGPELDGLDLCAPGPLWLGSDGDTAGEIGVSPRIGITKAADWPLRFYRRNSAFVSGPRRLRT